MSTFKNIQGKNIRSYANNAPNATAGEMWYNRTELKLKGVVASGTWSSSGSLGSARYDAGGGGIQTAGLIFGGRSPAIPSTNLTEEYNGSGWATGGNLNLGRQQMFSFGSQTAALGASGYKDSGGPGYRQESEEYNGTSWTEGNNCPIASFAGAGFGIQTAGVACGGRTPSPTNATAEYDGTNWTSGGNMTASLQQLFGAGTLTAGVTFGGNDGSSAVNVIQEYDGTSWSDAGDLPAARTLAGTSGIQTASIIFGGNAPGKVNTTLDYDGTSISSNPATLATARASVSFPSGAPASTNTSAFAAGGYSTTTVGNTEEYNFTANTVVPATWSSGGNLNAARFKMEMNGTQTATIAMGGGTMPSPPSSTTNSEYYDGSSWTAQPAMNNSRQRGGAGAFGTQTAAMSVSGIRNPPAPSNTVTDTEEWNGSNWTSGGAVPSGRYSACFFGTQTAGVFAGGNPGPSNTGATDSAEYNGSSFSAGNSMANGRYNATSGGTLTAGLVVMGTAGGSDTANCEEYDGTNYSAGGTSVIADQDLGGSGTQTNFSAFIGPTAQTLIYDGTSWRTDVTGATALGNVAGTGTSSTTGIVASGNPGTGTTLEYNVGTTALNYKNISSS